MKQLHLHKVREDEALKINVIDEPGAGGACHQYEITGFDTGTNGAIKDFAGNDVSCTRCLILFQNGPIKEKGTNGITQEALLAIVIDRLRSFQAGPFSSRENAIALTHLETALMWLKERTRERISRGVEGYTKV